MAKLEAGDKSSNSLLANVLDMDDDFLLAGGLRSNFIIFEWSLTLIVLLFRDFGDSREGRGQGSVQARPAAGGNSFCCRMLWIYEVCHTLRIRKYLHKVGGRMWVRVVTEVSSRVVLSRSGRFPITRCEWNSSADPRSRNLLLKRTRRERSYRVVPTVQGWQRVRFCHQVRGFLRNLIGRERYWVFDTVSW